MIYFVWLEGLRGPEAQLWDEKDKTEGGKPVKYLACHTVPDDAKIDDLKKLYPEPSEAKE